MNGNWSRDRFTEALHFAAESHGNQKVPGSDIPYLYHITLVAMEIIAALQQGFAGNPDLAVQCALLHDVMEDAGRKYEELHGKFGNAVAEGVLALTKNPALEKNLRMQDSIVRIKRQPYEIWMVKMADRISNLRKPPDFWTASKIIAYKNEACMIYEELSEADELLGKRLLAKIQEYDNNYC